MKCPALLLLLSSTILIADPAGLGPFGLSGWHRLPSSDVLPQGTLRIGAKLVYLDTEAGSIVSVPLRGCWGVSTDAELAVEVPLVPMDDVHEGSFTGDISLAGGWIYERTRGGTALKLTGRLTLPTGEEYRDRGAELAVGGATSTTFLDFRLSMAAEYAVNGGRNPFDEKLVDILYFTGGGSSYVTEDLLVSGSLSGSSSGKLEASAGGRFLLEEGLSAECGLIFGLDEPRDFAVEAGVYWSGEGF